MELATYIGVKPRSAFNNTGSTIGRGLRVVLMPTGTVILAGISARGDYITLADIATGESGLVIAIQRGNKCAAQTSEAVIAGDLAYSAANGQASKTAAGAVLVGRWTQAGGANALNELELFNPA